MWEKKSRKAKNQGAVLGKGAEFSGKLIFNGSVRIDGDFQGEISGQGIGCWGRSGGKSKY